MRLIGGLGLIASGVAGAPESGGTSFALLGAGIDQAITGLKEIVTGKNQKSIAHQVVERARLAEGPVRQMPREAAAAETLGLLVLGAVLRAPKE